MQVRVCTIRRMDIAEPVWTAKPLSRAVIQTKQTSKYQKIPKNGFVFSNHFFPANPSPSITKIYTLLYLHFQNFLRKLKVLAMPSSFTARLITLTTIIPVVSITVVVVSGPV